MKAKVVLVLVLGFMAILVWARISRGSRDSSAKHGKVENAAQPTADAGGGLRMARAVATVVTQSVVCDWRAIESTNYLTYIANLRAVHCPEETIRDIIVADVHKLYAPRRAAIRRLTTSDEYWQQIQSFQNDFRDRQAKKEMAALKQEESALLKKLLGVDPREEEEHATDYVGSRLQFLDPARREQVRAVRDQAIERYNALQDQRTKAGSYTPEIKAGFKRAMADERAALQKLLSSDELRQYDLQFSDAAVSLRGQLYGFAPSQSEFLALYDIKAAEASAAGHWTEPDSDTPAGAQRKQQARETAEAQIKALLGPERYADYVRTKDFAYRQINEFTEEMNLPRDVAAKVYDAKKAFDAQQKVVAALPADQREAMLSSLRQQAAAQVSSLLGSEAFQAYTQRDRGKWLRSQPQ